MRTQQRGCEIIKVWSHPHTPNTSRMYRGLIWMKVGADIKYKWPFIKPSRHRFPLALYNPVNRPDIYLSLRFKPSGYQRDWMGNSASPHCVNTIAQYTYSIYYFTIDSCLPGLAEGETRQSYDFSFLFLSLRVLRFNVSKRPGSLSGRSIARTSEGK